MWDKLLKNKIALGVVGLIVVLALLSAFGVLPSPTELGTNGPVQ